MSFLCAIQEAARAKQLREKFEKWEKTKDAADQTKQIMIHDENGDSLETATNLKARFEALQMQDTTPPPVRQKKFQVKRFKVKILLYQYPQNTNYLRHGIQVNRF